MLGVNLPLIPKKHTYLFNILCGELPQKIVNNVMEKAFKQEYRCRPFEVPKPGTQEYDCSFNQDYRLREQGFGYWALPGLKRQLRDIDINVVKRALVCIEELVHDPEKTFEALRLGMVPRLMDLLVHEDGFIRERVCMIYVVLTEQQTGCREIGLRYKAVFNLIQLLNDPLTDVKTKAQLVLYRLVKNCTGENSLNIDKTVIIILQQLANKPCEDALFHKHQLLMLKSLLNEDVKELAIRYGAMGILIEYAQSEDSEVAAEALSCLSMLCWTKRGRAQAAELRMLTQLRETIFLENRKTLGRALEMFAFGTLSTEGKNEMLTLDLEQKLLELANDFKHKDVQELSIRVLTQIAEHPNRRGVFREMKPYRNFIRGPGDTYKKNVSILRTVIRWRP